MYNSEFWMTLFSIVLFILGMVGGMLIDYIMEKSAAQKAQIKRNEAEIRRLKARISFLKSLLDERNER